MNKPGCVEMWLQHLHWTQDAAKQDSKDKSLIVNSQKYCTFMRTKMRRVLYCDLKMTLKFSLLISKVLTLGTFENISIKIDTLTPEV